MLLSYEFPEYMEGAVPIAFDGGGTFYLFDMRAEPKDGEYPVFFAGSGALFWEDAIHVCNSFDEMIEGTTDPHEHA